MIVILIVTTIWGWTWLSQVSSSKQEEDNNKEKDEEEQTDNGDDEAKSDEDSGKFLSNVDNVTDANFGNLSLLLEQNLTLPNNFSKFLFLKINVTNERFNFETLEKLGYYIHTHIKADRYNDRINFPLSDDIIQNNVLMIPIVNNTQDTDDGGDFRIDVSINHYDDKFIKVNYPIKYHTTFKSVNIDQILRHVIQDEKDEGSYFDEGKFADSERLAPPDKIILAETLNNNNVEKKVNEMELKMK